MEKYIPRMLIDVIGSSLYMFHLSAQQNIGPMGEAGCIVHHEMDKPGSLLDLDMPPGDPTFLPCRVQLRGGDSGGGPAAGLPDVAHPGGGGVPGRLSDPRVALGTVPPRRKPLRPGPGGPADVHRPDSCCCRLL